MSPEAVGHVLVPALLITPAPTARMLTDRWWAMTMPRSGIGCAGSVAGLYGSYAYDLAAGGSVVVVATGVFITTWCPAPRHGLLTRALRQRVTPEAGAPRDSRNFLKAATGGVSG